MKLVAIYVYGSEAYALLNNNKTQRQTKANFDSDAKNS
jgi:hypothetical protein